MNETGISQQNKQPCVLKLYHLSSIFYSLKGFCKKIKGLMGFPGPFFIFKGFPRGKKFYNLRQAVNKINLNDVSGSDGSTGKVLPEEHEADH